MCTSVLPVLRANLSNLKDNEHGQTFVEYVMIIVLVALAVYIANPDITSAIMNVFTDTSSALSAP